MAFGEGAFMIFIYNLTFLRYAFCVIAGIFFREMTILLTSAAYIEVKAYMSEVKNVVFF